MLLNLKKPIAELFRDFYKMEKLGEKKAYMSSSLELVKLWHIHMIRQ